MQQPPQARPSPDSSNFAGLLESLTSPGRDAKEDETAWSGGDLGEDVATLSYEQALRAHARYRPLDRDDRSLTQTAGVMPGEARQAASGREIPVSEELAPEAEAAPVPWAERELRSASVTIRLNQVECARLRNRAAEAGLTVSAYLRSCSVEAETLRAQVKQALAELRAGTEGSSHPSGKAAGDPSREQGNKAAREQSTAAAKPPGAPTGIRGMNPRASEGVWLTRVFGHIGRLCVGLSSVKSP